MKITYLLEPETEIIVLVYNCNYYTNNILSFTSVHSTLFAYAHRRGVRAPPWHSRAALAFGLGTALAFVCHLGVRELPCCANAALAYARCCCMCASPWRMRAALAYARRIGIRVPTGWTRVALVDKIITLNDFWHAWRS